MLWKPQKMARLLHVKTLKPAVKSVERLWIRAGDGNARDLPLSDQMSLIRFYVITIRPFQLPSFEDGADTKDGQQNIKNRVI